MYKIRKVLDFISEKLSIAIMAVTTALVVWQVVSRYIFHSPVPWSEALAKYMFVWLVLINAAYIFGKREHMNIGFFKDHMPEKLQKPLNIFNEIVVLIFAVGILVIGGWAAMKVGIPQKDAALKISMGYVYAALPLSGIITTIYTICNIADIVMVADKKAEPKQSNVCTEEGAA